MRILTVVGARPQFIKAAPVSRLLAAQHTEILVHTGQHYDDALSNVFFRDLGMPQPDHHLGVGSGSQGWQTGQMLIRLEEVLQAETPDAVLVYGDTNSTLAGALAACKQRVPVAHVEAGLRSFNRAMPEEYNRLLADHCADRLFCPTQTAVRNLAAEGITAGVYLVGDTMYDALLQFAPLAQQRSNILHDNGLAPKQYLLATLHRPYNTDDPVQLGAILEALAALPAPVILPVHPRTRRRMAEFGLQQPAAGRLRLIDPVGYLDMLALEQNARLILTDSGGLQKEAYLLRVPCVTLRPETEWVETVAAGWNRLAWHDPAAIRDAVLQPWPGEPPPPVFGDGHAAERIVARLA